MQNIGEVVDGQFVDELLENLRAIGVSQESIRAILIEGSALYIENPHDIDFKVIVNRENPKAEIGKSFFIKGYKVECTHYTLDEWNNIDRSSRIYYYLTQTPDMILVYGTDEGFKRFDVVADEEIARKVYDIYDKYLFNYDAENARTAKRVRPKMPPKRLWNFLLFAFKRINRSHILTDEQRRLVQDAHDLKLSVESYRGLFKSLFHSEETQT